MTRIRGEQLYLFMGDDVLSPVGASTDCSISMSADTVEVSSRGQGKWRKFRPSKKSWMINCAGFYFDQLGIPSSLAPGSRMVGSIVRIAISVLSRQLVESGFQLSEITPDEEMTMTGEAVITSCEFSGSVGSVATYSISLQGTGDLTQIV